METESPSTEQSPSPEPSGAPVRSTNDRLVGGVCAGLAAVLGLDAAVVRVAAIVLAVTGTGMPLYAVGYVLMSEGVTEPQVDDAPSEVRRALGLALVVVGLVSTQAALNLAPPAAVVWPVVVVGIGVGVVVWRTDWEFGSTRSEALRIAAGILVVGAGVAALVAGSISFDAVRSSILAIGLVVGGLALIVGPWIAVVLNDRSEERRRRLQADARADMAAHLHDSVLQTFALIQRTDDPRRITQLARQQERELRRWLYAVSDDPGATTLRSSIESAAAGVEDRFDVTVSTVVVGDAAMTPALDALVAATSDQCVEVVGERPGIGVRRGRGRRCAGLRARHRRGVRSRCGCRRPARCARVDHRADGTHRRHRHDHLVARNGYRGRAVRPGPAVDAPGYGLIMALAPPRVVLVDDHQMFRSGVRAELGDRVSVVAEADDVAQAVAVIEQWSPDVVLLDVHLPSGTGREVIEAIDRAGVDTKFLALSVSDAAEDVIDVVRAGARGYVTKTISADDLVDAIVRVSDGDAVFSPRLAGFVLDAFTVATSATELPDDADDDLDRLTKREQEVLRHLARGYTYKEIARQLSISVKTVETHASAVLRKLQLSNRNELSRWAAARRIW